MKNPLGLDLFDFFCQPVVACPLPVAGSVLREFEDDQMSALSTIDA
jgi:hypothetical protein